MQQTVTLIEQREKVEIGDQAELLLNGSIYRYYEWDLAKREFKRLEVVEDVRGSLAYSPLFEQVFEIGKLQFYRRRDNAIV